MRPVRIVSPAWPSWPSVRRRETYFEEYARDLAEDCGLIPDELAWPMWCIDWERAARELRMDYRGGPSQTVSPASVGALD